MKSRFLFIVLLLCSSIAFAQFQKVRFQVNGISLPYQVLYPEGFDDSKQYPLLVFLHGAGERGNDNEKQLTHGKDFLLQAQQQCPAIVIAPQCPDDSYWSNVKINGINNKITFTFGESDIATPPMNALIALVNDWLSSGLIDTKQVYVGGLSMGGMGTFELLWRMPNTFAAAFPICGGGDTGKVSTYAKNTSVWIFHGDSDGVVPVSNSQVMHHALQQAGCDVKYTEYPGVNHNSWENAFAEKNLFPWLFNHKK
ncbi:dienelactone hydrolase family protein [Dysgonomonas sp. ZJ709]|uniref:carboxylesterase family protein n=1 Tax=Dysgonomonas sp. ZJ709 TaxID=2709797 RepID=UPI0013EA92D5|nr:dienelactone hydrolase family protein [Dysgonomonas sp. ZJ709]